MEERKNIVYTAADLQRYHSGSMSEAEMHALEKAALDDPFLTEALEGYAYTSTAEKDIIELKKRIAGEEEKKKTAIIFFNKKRTWLSAAAVLALIFGTVYLTFKLNNKKDSTLAKNKEVQQTTVFAGTDSIAQLKSDQATASTTIETDTTKINQELAAVQKVPASSSKKINNNNLATGTTANGHGIKELMDSIATNKTADEKKSQVFAKAQAEQAETKRINVTDDETTVKDKAPLANAKSKNQARYRFTGKVVDEHGAPVGFASISSSPGTNATTTDASGNFSITGRDSIFPATIASVGYNRLKKELKNNIDQTIVLSRDTQQLTAVVVTAMGQVRQKSSVGYSSNTVKAAEIGDIKNVFSQPETGMDKFKAYLKDSIKRPQTNEGTYYKGDVVLSFKIKKNGNPHNVKVEKSLCEACDEEAKRLLLAGPKWKYINNKRTTVTISF
ncbi:MAG: carboxypeptidase-like regulatory domain-containing protein [Ferruginibacter sp.]